METMQGAQTVDHYRGWFPSAQPSLNDHLGNKMGAKRTVSEDSKYPPKKRALMEHKAKIMQNSADMNSGHSEHKSEYSLPKGKQDFHQMYSRPRSDSLHSNISVMSEYSDIVSSASQEDGASPFQPLYDHHTPERNPLKNLNPQIAKPLFKRSDNEKSLSESQKSDNHATCIDGNDSPPKISQRDDFDSGIKHNMFVQKQVLSKENMLQNAMHESGVKENMNYSDHANNDGCHGSKVLHTENTYMGPMVSLIHRFNAEKASESMEQQSSNETLQNKLVHSYKENASILGEKWSDQSNNRSHNFDSTSFDQLPRSNEHLSENGVTVMEHNEKDAYKCIICNKLIKQKGHFLAHLKSHEEENCKCRICGTELQSLDKLQHHMKTVHKGDNPYKCEHCSREFSQYNNLRRHLRVHSGKVFKCELCDREFNEEFYLTMHMGTHTGKRVYSCGVCNACFGSSHDLKMHVKTHSPSQLHTCDVCGKSFSKACVLRQHKKGHTGDRPHKCDKCPKTFIHRHHLTMHMRSHTENKPYTCDICKKEFYQSSHLYKHLRCHDNENEEPAVIAMREKLGKISAVKSVDRNRPCLSAVKENSSAGNGNTASQMNKALWLDRSRSRQGDQSTERSYQEMSRSQEDDCVQERSLISQERSHTDEKIYRPLTTPGAHFYQSRPPLADNQNQYPQPNAFPAAIAPRFYGMPPFQAPGYNPMYLAYAAQVRAYYNNMYMMNYVSHSAAEHPGTQVRQNGDSHMTKDHTGHLTRTTNEFGRTQTTESSTTTMDNIIESPKDNQRDGLNCSHGNLFKNEHSYQNDETRTEVAKELVKMSGGRVSENEMKVATDPAENSYHVDESRSFSFTKCISDVIHKTLKIQDQRHNQLLSRQTDMTRIEHNRADLEAVKQEPLFTNVNTSSSSMLRQNESLLQPASESMDGVLNLSQKGCVATNLIPAQVSHSRHMPHSQISQNHEMRSSQDCDNPVYSGPHYTSNRSVNPGVNHSFAINRLLASNQGNYTVKNQLASIRESPKKRHASSQDHEQYKARLDHRYVGINRTRHFSENVVDSFEKSKVERVEVKKETRDHVEHLTPLLDSVGKSSCHRNMDDKEKSHAIDKEAGRNAITEDTEKESKEEPLVKASDIITDESGVKAWETNSKSKETNCEKDEIEEESDDIKALRRKIAEINEQIKFEKEKKAKASMQSLQKVNSKETEKDENCEEEGNAFKKAKIENYFDDSLEEKRLEIDLNISEEKANVDPESSSENSKMDINVDQDTLNKPEYLNMQETLDDIQKSVKVEEDVREGIEKDNAMIDKTEVDVEENLVGEVNNKNACTDMKMEINENGAYAEDRDAVKGIGINKLEEKKDKDLTAESTLTCVCCWKMFDTKSELEEHQLQHVRDLSSSNTCDQCNQVFARPFDLQCHIMKFHSGGISDLSVEKENWYTSQSLKAKTVSPSRARENEKTGYQCEFCDVKSGTADEFRNHLSTHTGDKPYLCNVCFRSFAHKHNLNRHKMSHNSKSFECGICKRTFKETFYLQMHMKIHSEKTQRCEICGQQVPKSEIWRHTSRHLGNIVENPTYEQIGHRVQEILREQNTNKGAEEINMKVLTEQFANVSEAKGSLDQLAKLMQLSGNMLGREAIKNCENFNTQLENCNSIYPKGLQSRQNIRNESNSNHLKEILSSLENRNIPDTAEKDETFKARRDFVKNETRCHICKTCGKGFKKKCVLRTHEKIHMAEKPFKCAYCGATYQHFHHLQVHAKVHNSAIQFKGDNWVQVIENQC